MDRLLPARGEVNLRHLEVIGILEVNRLAIRLFRCTIRINNSDPKSL